MASSDTAAENQQEIKNYVGQVTASGDKIFNTLQQIAQGIEEFSQNTAGTSR